MGMTIEEAIPILHDMYNYYNDVDVDAYIGFDNEDNNAIETALETMRKYQKIEQILNRLKVKMKDRDEDNGGEPLNAVDRGYHLAYEHLCEEIDNLLKENENGNED